MGQTLPDFATRRRAEVRRVLASGGGGDLTSFLHALPGYWPADVVDDLRELTDSDLECSGAALQILSTFAGTAQDPDLGDPVRRALPVPHPLDADWRFTVGTRERLLDIAASLSPRRETLLLGTPSIFAYMCSQLDLRAAILVDANQATVDAANRLAEGHDLLQARHADLLSSIETGLAPDFDTAIADPPWYWAEHASFLDAASALLVPGGVLLMAAAPRGTRPSAEDDRSELLAHAFGTGLDLAETMRGQVEYTSSPFERAALRECGLASVPTNWRRADLLIFRKSTRLPLRAQMNAGRPPGWIDRATGRTRLKVNRAIAPTSADPFHFTGKVSESVSSLAAERQTANLWTSGNGAFNISGELLHALATCDPGWRDTVAGQALQAHLETELADLRDWGWM